MTAIKCSVIFFFIIFLVSIQSDKETNDLLRKSVGFSYYLTDGFSKILSNSDKSILAREIPKIYSTQSGNMTFNDFIPVIKTASYSYIGVLICIIIGVLFIILMPIVGLCICCCRCCNRCGARPKLAYSKHDKSKLGCYSIALLILATIQLIATIIAFINLHLSDQAVVRDQDNVITESKAGIQGFNDALDNMLKQAQNVTNADLSEERTKFFKTVDELLEQFNLDLMNHESIHKFTDHTAKFIKVIEEFSDKSKNANDTLEIVNRFEGIMTVITNLRSDISKKLDVDCSTDEITQCKLLKDETEKNMITTYQSSDFENAGNIVKIISDHSESFSKLKRIDVIWKSIDLKSKIDREIEKAWQDLSSNQENRKQLTSMFDSFGKNTKEKLNNVVKSLSEASENIVVPEMIRFYVTIGILSIALWIIFLIFLGLCFGTCGNRPYSDAGACNKGVGANLLLAALGFIFIFSSIMMIFCLASFVSGTLVQSEVCQSFEPTESKEKNFFDTYFSLFVNSSDIFADRKEDLTHLRPVDAIWNRCANYSLVDSLGGPELKLPVDKEINTELERIMNEFSNVDITGPISQKIDELIKEFDSLEHLTRYDLKVMTNKLTSYITKIANLEKYSSQLENLKNQDFNREVGIIRNDIISLDKKRPVLTSYINQLEMGVEEFTKAGQKLKEIREKCDEIVKPIFSKELENLKSKFFGQLRLAVLAMFQPIMCKDVHLSAKRTSDAFCKKFVQPFNGIWSGLGLCLLLFIPCIFLILGLVSIYRKTEEYMSDFQEQSCSDLENFISFKGYYLTPKDDLEPSIRGQKPKKKNKNDARNNKGYAPISVYPYDAYE